jgi:hypothetical protein
VLQKLKINWHDYFKIQHPDTVTLQVIPDRTVRNNRLDILTKSLWEVFTPLHSRISHEGMKVTYKKQPNIWWEIYFTAGSVTFFLTIPKSYLRITRQRLNTVWPRATIQTVAFIPFFDSAKSNLLQINLKEHNLLSLDPDRRENAPLPTLLNVVRDIIEDDKAILQLGLTPLERLSWNETAAEALLKWKKNIPLKRWNANPVVMIIDGVGNTLDLISKIINTILDNLPGGNMESDKSFDKRTLFTLDKQKKDLTHATTLKAISPTFTANIIVAAQSQDETRRKVTVQALGTSLRELNGDNELQTGSVYFHKRCINQLNKRQMPIIRFGKTVLSTSEVGSLMRIPTGPLQEEFPEVKQVSRREITLPNSITTSGIFLGDTQFKGQTVKSYFPLTNRDDACLPLNIIGGMGSGKSLGSGAGFAADAVRAGNTVFLIDTANGALCDAARDSLPEDFSPNHIIDLDFGNSDWPIALGWNEVATYGGRQAQKVVGKQLVNFLERFADNPGDQTRSITMMAAQAAYTDPTATLLEVGLVLSSSEYREKLLKEIKNPRLHQNLEDYHAMSEGARSQATRPVWSRLNRLLDDENLANCLCQKGKFENDKPLLDFRKFADAKDGPYLVCLRVPKSKLLPEATNALVTYLVSKLWLAVLTRYDGNWNKPAWVIMDEPHQYLGATAEWSDMIVESRKWGLGLVFLFHSFVQLPKDFSRVMKAAGPHIVLYASSTAGQEFKDLEKELAPFELEEFLALPKHHALVSLYSGGRVPVFSAAMAQPPIEWDENPEYRKSGRYTYIDRRALVQKCSTIYGARLEAVENDIWKRERQARKKNAAK